MNRAPWQAFGPAKTDPLNNQKLELYDLNKDFSQAQNIVAKFPDKVKAMKAMFIAEAKKYQVFPMDASVALQEIIFSTGDFVCRRLRVFLADYTRKSRASPSRGSMLSKLKARSVAARVRLVERVRS